ncbi:Nn.00g027350.m01.CDS01 [Neocucurbitaria sp. VM-36]
MSDDVGAKKLGEKLLMEVEVEDLSEVFTSVRELDLRNNGSENDQTTLQTPVFGIPELDALLPGTSKPIIELISAPGAHHPSGAGKTSLLYLIITHAISPFLFSSSVKLGGQDAAVIVLDPMNHFSVSRLADVMLSFLTSRVQAAGIKTVDNDNMKAEMKSLIKHCMQHVHIFRPQSWPSLLATLRALPDYLLDGKARHKSMHRRVHSVILDDVDAFAWSIRNSSSSSSAAPTTTTTTSTRANPLSTASTHLTNTLQKLSALFSNATILTSYSTSSSSPSYSSPAPPFRPVFPTSWPQRPPGARAGDAAIHSAPVTRLAVRRVEVLKFAPAISVEEAEAERQQRWEVVSRGRFECWKVGVGVGDGEGFVFRVGRRGVVLEERGDVK